jgi:hypothetical protein
VSDLDEIVLRYLTEAPASHFYGLAVAITDTWQGSDNVLYRVRVAPVERFAKSPNGGNEIDAVVKLYPDAGYVRGRRQYDAQMAFSLIGLAPRPLWFDREPENLAWQVLVYPWVEGEMPTGAEPGVAAALARAAAAIHASDAETLPRYAPHAMSLQSWWQVVGQTAETVARRTAGVPELGEAFAALAGRARAAVEAALPLWAGTGLVPVHGDLALENALVTDGGQLLLLDWEMSGLGDPALEVARFLAQTPLDLPGWEDAWLAEYLSASDRPGLAERIATYRALLPFEWLCRLLDGLHQVEGDGAEAITAAERADLRTLIAAVWQRAATALGVEPPAEEVGTLLS